jgi:hypothetical protein
VKLPSLLSTVTTIPESEGEDSPKDIAAIRQATEEHDDQCDASQGTPPNRTLSVGSTLAKELPKRVRLLQLVQPVNSTIDETVAASYVNNAINVCFCKPTETMIFCSSAYPAEILTDKEESERHVVASHAVLPARKDKVESTIPTSRP